MLGKDGTWVKVNKDTLRRRVNGGKSRRGVQQDQKWLMREEEEQIIHEFQTLAACATPPNHDDLKEHANEILHARLGNNFPKEGVGKQWVHRFLAEHDDQLGTFWSHNLNNARARGVNPTNNTEYWDMLENVIRKEDNEDYIPEHLHFAGDETGFMKGIGGSQRVIGRKGQKIQQKRCNGNCENTTVLVTICGNGTALKPTVIFKGEGLQTSWGMQKNPLNVS